MYNWSERLVAAIVERLLSRRKKNPLPPDQIRAITPVLRGLVAEGAFDDHTVVNGQPYFLFLDVHFGEWVGLARSVRVRIPLKDVPTVKTSFIYGENRIISGEKSGVLKIWQQMKKSN